MHSSLQAFDLLVFLSQLPLLLAPVEFELVQRRLQLELSFFRLLNFLLEVGAVCFVGGTLLFIVPAEDFGVRRVVLDFLQLLFQLRVLFVEQVNLVVERFQAGAGLLLLEVL